MCIPDSAPASRGGRGRVRSSPCPGRLPRPAAGLTLIELAIFIAVVGVGVAGILSVLDFTTRRSSDPLPQKQALSIAESLLEEVQLMPFTFCDPDDANAATATSPADCTGGVNGPNDEGRSPLGPEAGEGETRYGPVFFDNVNDYNGFDTATASLPGIRDITGTLIPGLEAYRASVAVVQEPLGGIPADAALRITVTVTGPAGTRVTLDGYRTRFSPNALP